jgi:hypothetical protein
MDTVQDTEHTALEASPEESTPVLYYSPSTRGFYDSGIHGDAIPDDAVEIPPDLHRTLLDGQSEGKLIMPPDGGHPLPYPADPPAPAPEELAARRKAVISARLAEIDAASVRPLRALARMDGL